MWRLLVHTLTSAVARDLLPTYCMGPQWALWLPTNHTPGALVCFCRAGANLIPDLVSAFGVLWVGQGVCTFRLGSKASNSKPACMHSSQVQSSLLQSLVCVIGFPGRQGNLSPPFGNLMGCPNYSFPCSPPRAGVHLYGPSLPYTSRQVCRFRGNAFVFYPTRLHEDLFYSFDCIVLLPVSSFTWNFFFSFLFLFIIGV